MSSAREYGITLTERTIDTIALNHFGLNERDNQGIRSQDGSQILSFSERESIRSVCGSSPVLTSII